MAYYYPLLAKAVAGLAQSTPESRRAIYERARRALLGQLRSMDPPVPEPDIDRESRALDDAIAQLEKELTEAAAQKPVDPEAPLPPPAPESVVSVEPPPPPAEFARAAQEPEPELSPLPQPPAQKERPSIRPVAPMREGVTADRPARKPIPPLPPIPQRPQMPVRKGRVPAPIAAPGDAKLETEGVSPPGSPMASDAATTEVMAPGIEMAASDQATIAVDIADDRAGKPEPLRPAAPTPPPQRSKKARATILTLVVLVIAAGVGALAFKLRDKPEDILRSRPQPTAEQPQDAPNKIVERIGAGQAPTAPVRPAQTTTTQPPRQATPPEQSAIPVAQRAALLVDAPDDPQKFKTYIGNVVWRLDNVSRGAGQPLTSAVRAEADIPEAKLKVSILFQVNADDNLPASHTLTVRFTQTDGTFPPVDQIDLPQMRNEVSPAVDSLFGVQAKITQGMFLVGLTRETNLFVRNIEMLKNRGWLDIPMRFADGRIAKVTLEKGPAGDRIVNDAFAAWGQ